MAQFIVLTGPDEVKLRERAMQLAGQFTGDHITLDEDSAPEAMWHIKQGRDTILLIVTSGPVKTTGEHIAPPQKYRPTLPPVTAVQLPLEGDVTPVLDSLGFELVDITTKGDIEWVRYRNPDRIMGAPRGSWITLQEDGLSGYIDDEFFQRDFKPVEG